MTDSNNTSKIISDNIDIDRSMFKIAILAILSIVSLSSFGFFIKIFLQNNEFKNFIIAAVSVSIFLVFFLLQTFFIKSSSINVLIIFLSCVGLLGSFYNKFSNSAILIAIGLVFLALFFANLNGIKELRNMLKINFWKTSKTVLPKAIAAILLFISIIYFYNNSEENEDFFISQKNFEKIILSPTMIITQKFYPEIDASLTINQLAANFAKKQIEEVPELSILPQAAQKIIINQAAAEFEKQIANFIGASAVINKKATMSEIIYKTIKDKFNSLPENIKSLVLIGIVLSVFLTLEILALPIRIIVSIVAFLIYELFLTFGFASIELERRSKEIVVLK